MAGTLFVVATPIGNLEDITARALRVLREVAVIAAEDTRRTAHLLAHYGISTSTTSLHEHNEREKTSTIIARLQRGESVALVSDAGTPGISDPGVHLVGTAAGLGIKIEPIPGPSAALAALSVAGVPVEGFRLMGFPPTRSSARKQWFERLASSSPGVVFYEAPHRLLHTLDELREAIGDEWVLVARELTKAHEELVRGPISEIVKQLKTIKGEFTVVVKIGLSIENAGPRERQRPTDLALATEFGEMTANRAATRRQAIAAISRKYGISARETYAAIEAAKNSGC